jgi:DNA-binding transcriptional ArsR family regulator
MLDMLRDGPLTTGDLSAAFPELSRFAVMQHLGVLTEANLVIVQRQGRQRFNYLNAVPIREIYERWVSRYAGHWASALIGLKRALEQPEAHGKGGDVERPRGTSATGAGSKPVASKKRIPKASARNPKGRVRRSSSRKESDS